MVEQTFEGYFKSALNTDTIPNRYESNEFQTSIDETDLIGRGGYSTVFRCRHPELGSVAIKHYRLYQGQEKPDKIIENVARETAILTKISHHNIVDFYGYTSYKKGDDTFICIIIELCQGNLDEFIQKSKEENETIPWKLRLRLLYETTSALEYLHFDNPNRSFVHGDLKPQNVLLSNDLTVKLADFGSTEIEKAVGVTSVSINIEPNRQHTPIYTAPEFLKDPFLPKNCSMDVYSLAMVGYEIITLVRVFSNSNIKPRLIVNSIIDLGVKPDSEQFIKVSQSLENDGDAPIFEGLKKVVQKCWSKVSESRPNAKQVLQELEDLAGEDFKAKPDDKYQSDFAGSFLKRKNESHETIKLSQYPRSKSYSKENKDKPFIEHRLKKIDKSHLTKEYSLETLTCYQETTETNSCAKSHSLNEVNNHASMEHCLSNVVTVISTVKSVEENKENKELQCAYAEDDSDRGKSFTQVNQAGFTRTSTEANTPTGMSSTTVASIPSTPVPTKPTPSTDSPIIIPNLSESVTRLVKTTDACDFHSDEMSSDKQDLSRRTIHVYSGNQQKISREKPLVDSLKESNAHHKTLTDDSIPDKENREKHQKSESPCSTSQTPYDIASFQLNKGDQDEVSTSDSISTTSDEQSSRLHKDIRESEKNLFSHKTSETSSSSNIEETEDCCTNITTDQPGFHTTDGNFPDDENHQHPPTPQLSGSVSSSNQPTSSTKSASNKKVLKKSKPSKKQKDNTKKGILNSIFSFKK